MYIVLYRIVLCREIQGPLEVYIHSIQRVCMCSIRTAVETYSTQNHSKDDDQGTGAGLVLNDGWFVAPNYVGPECDSFPVPSPSISSTQSFINFDDSGYHGVYCILSSCKLESRLEDVTMGMTAVSPDNEQWQRKVKVW